MYSSYHSLQAMAGGGNDGWNLGRTKVAALRKQRTQWISRAKLRDGSLKCWIHLRLSLSLYTVQLSVGRALPAHLTPWIPPLPPHALAQNNLAPQGPLRPPFHSTGKQTCRTTIVNARLQNFTGRCLISSSTGLLLFLLDLVFRV